MSAVDDESAVAESCSGLRRCPPRLPLNIITEYMNEGAANVLYRVSCPKSSPEGDAISAHGTTLEDGRESLWNGKLLRLRKKLPTTVPCQVNQASYETIIKPHFRHCDLVDQQLVEIGPSGIILPLNQELKKWETMPRVFRSPSMILGRPPKRRGTYLADDNYGLLVRDMSPNPSQELYEFKPKWLVQSPAAPECSKRCRTCAKRAQDNALMARSDLKSSVPLSLTSFCPLDLASKSDSALSRAGKSILNLDNHNAPLTSVQSAKLAHFVTWAKTSPLLAQLKRLQVVLDQNGVFASNPEDKDFLTAMTLRDCSVFLHISLNTDSTTPITARISDLDLKSPTRMEYWRNIERSLVDGGWYTGTEREEYKQPLDCALFPEARTPVAERAALRVLKDKGELR